MYLKQFMPQCSEMSANAKNVLIKLDISTLTVSTNFGFRQLSEIWFASRGVGRCNMWDSLVLIYSDVWFLMALPVGVQGSMCPFSCSGKKRWRSGCTFIVMYGFGIIRQQEGFLLCGYHLYAECIYMDTFFDYSLYEMYQLLMCCCPLVIHSLASPTHLWHLNAFLCQILLKLHMAGRKRSKNW
jgi:hypothetical protein